MALVKPVRTEKGTPWFGIVPVSIWDFKDRSADYDWADLFLSCEVKIENSEYNRFVEIAGQLDRDPNGQVTGGNVLKRIYRFFEVIGCDAGINTQGKWEDADGQVIEDIGSYLNERYTTGNPIMDPSYKHLAYIYKAAPKTPGGKVYTRCLPRLASNDTEGHKDLKSHVEWMTSKGYLREVTETSSNGEATKTQLNNL